MDARSRLVRSPLRESSLIGQNEHAAEPWWTRHLTGCAGLTWPACRSAARRSGIASRPGRLIGNMDSSRRMYTSRRRRLIRTKARFTW